MLVEHGKVYVAAFSKPWWVTPALLAVWARPLGIKIEGFWPKGHPNAPAIVVADTGRPWTHLIGGRMDGPSQELELPKEIAWVTEFRSNPPMVPFVVRRRTG